MLDINSLPIIPDAYQEVEYIASSGTQCINTGYYWVTENTKVLADIMVTANSEYQSLWGNEEYYSDSARYFAGIPHGSNFTYAYYLGTGGCVGFSLTQNSRTQLMVETSSDKKYQIYKDGSKIVDSSFSTSMLTYAGAAVKTSNTGRIFVFSNHNSGTSGTTAGGNQIIGGMRCYKFGLYDNGEWQRYLIPCYRKSDNEVGMYDIVNKVFYTNSGTGSFTYGSLVNSFYHQPQMTYSVKLNGTTTSSGAGKVSFISGYNNIAVTRNCSDQSTNDFQVWVTKATATNWGLGVGIKACEDSSALSVGTSKQTSFTATSSIFTQGDGLYRLALCTRGDLDMTWDVTEVLIEVSGLIWKPTDADGVELVVSDM